MRKLKLGVLISGRGSNLQSLIDACSDKDFPAEISVVISNKPDAYGLQRAEKAGIKAVAIKPKDFEDKDSYEAEMDVCMRECGVQLVCLAGFMRILGNKFVTGWKDRMINIHPSLLPSFKGLHTHQRAIEAGCRFTGCTIHYVVPDLDSGPILSQAAIPISADDTPDSLADKVLSYEHVMYPDAVKLIANGAVRVSGNKVIITNMSAPIKGVTNPKSS